MTVQPSKILGILTVRGGGSRLVIKFLIQLLPQKTHHFFCLRAHAKGVCLITVPPCLIFLPFSQKKKERETNPSHKRMHTHAKTTPHPYLAELPLPKKKKRAETYLKCAVLEKINNTCHLLRFSPSPSISGTSAEVMSL